MLDCDGEGLLRYLYKNQSLEGAIGDGIASQMNREAPSDCFNQKGSLHLNYDNSRKENGGGT